MPVWQEIFEPLRESGELQVVGIVQEQHPERTRLYAQWREYDWPILWDPFNTTHSKVVLNAYFIDEYGILRAERLRPDKFMQWFDKRTISDEDEFAADDEPVAGLPRAWSEEQLAENPDRRRQQLLARLVWNPNGQGLDAVAELDVLAQAAGVSGELEARLAFELGTAFRMRYDSGRREAGDFQRAVDYWSRANRSDSNQYIWRRRLQQYGPLLDKPYNFYRWMDEARAEIEARGDMPEAVRVRLTTSELAGRKDVVEAKSIRAEEPDPGGRMQRDKDGDEACLALEIAVVSDTERRRDGAAQSALRVHLTFTPATKLDVHWGDEAGPLVVWLEPPNGLELESRRFEVAPALTPGGVETRGLDFGLEVPGSAGGRIEAYAIYPVCEGETGVCRMLRRDFSILLPGS